MWHSKLSKSRDPIPCLLYSLTTPILRIYAKVASSPNLKERMPASSLLHRDFVLTSATRRPIIFLLNVAANEKKRVLDVISSYQTSGYSIGNHTRHKRFTSSKSAGHKALIVSYERLYKPSHLLSNTKLLLHNCLKIKDVLFSSFASIHSRALELHGWICKLLDQVSWLLNLAKKQEAEELTFATPCYLFVSSFAQQ